MGARIPEKEEFNGLSECYPESSVQTLPRVVAVHGVRMVGRTSWAEKISLDEIPQCLVTLTYM